MFHRHHIQLSGKLARTERAKLRRTVGHERGWAAETAVSMWRKFPNDSFALFLFLPPPSYSRANINYRYHV